MTTPANNLMPPSLREAKRNVFHYTPAAGLLGIVESGCLWASEASSLNDLAEVRRGWEVVRRWLDGRRAKSGGADLLGDLAMDPLQEKHEVFVLSGSTAGDDANQWRLYAQAGKGYAIELSPRVRLAAVSKTPERTKKKSGVISWYLGEVVAVTPWYHVLYSESEAVKALRELERATQKELGRIPGLATSHDHFSELRDDLKGKAYEALGTIAHLIKEPGFSGENEVRVVTTYLFADQHIRYRPAEHGIVSYGLLTTAPRGHQTTRILHRPHMDGQTRPGDPLPVRSVRLGPLLGEEHSNTVRRLLAKNDLTAADMSSNVRLRQYWRLRRLVAPGTMRSGQPVAGRPVVDEPRGDRRATMKPRKMFTTTTVRRRRWTGAGRGALHGCPDRVGCQCDWLSLGMRDRPSPVLPAPMRPMRGAGPCSKWRT